jgi:hypothetical protein
VVTNNNPTKYYIDESTVEVSQNTISATIKSRVKKLPMLSLAASELSLNLAFYQDGIARVTIDELNGAEKRFRISDEKDFAVMQE